MRLPPRDTFVLAFEEGQGWWKAQHCPADDGSTPNDGITDWHFVGDDASGQRQRVTHGCRCRRRRANSVSSALRRPGLGHKARIRRREQVLDGRATGLDIQPEPVLLLIRQ
jgi:hypothetical protein